MSFRAFGLLAVAVLPLASAAVSASEPEKKLVKKVFNVADLVTPVPEYVMVSLNPSSPPAKKPKKPATTAESGEQLVKLTTAMVRPYSWDGMGGSGKAEYFDLGTTLVVTNTTEVVAEVADLLEALRRLQDVSVSTEVRVLKVPAGFRERVGLTGDANPCLTEREVRLLMEAVQGNRESSVMQFPKVTSFDGQEVTVRAGDQRLFVTSVEAVRSKGTMVPVPKNTAVDLGDTLTLQGRASADGKFVNLQAKLTRTRLIGKVERIPITMQVTPIFEGGSQGKPIPFTQFLEVPDLKTECIEKTAIVPTGGTMVLGGWKEPIEVKPVLTKIPYLKRLYKDVDPVECEVIVLATTRIVRAEPAEAPTPRAER